jgi:hypothetical protein
MADDPRNNGEKTPRAMPEGKRFEAGNPGRPKGARNKLGEAFVSALHDDFAEHGVGALAKVREEDPAAYMRVIAGLLPKEFKIETTSDLTDEQLDARIRTLASVIGLQVGTGVAAGGAGEAGEAQPSQDVSAIH